MPDTLMEVVQYSTALNSLSFSAEYLCIRHLFKRICLFGYFDFGIILWSLYVCFWVYYSLPFIYPIVLELPQEIWLFDRCCAGEHRSWLLLFSVFQVGGYRVISHYFFNFVLPFDSWFFVLCSVLPDSFLVIIYNGWMGTFPRSNSHSLLYFQL